MTDKDTDEVLRLLRKINVQLMSMQVKIGAYAAVSALKEDQKTEGDAISNVLLLIIDSYIIYLGYNYLTSTKTTLQPVAVIGVIGITSVILNSVFTTSRNIYSSYKTHIRLEKAKESARERLEDPASRFSQFLSTIDPHTPINVGNVISISEDIFNVMNKFSEEIIIPARRNAPPSNNDRQDVRKTDETP